MTKSVFFSACVLTGWVAGIADAQYYPPVYQSRASTVGESYARGMSDIIQSKGAANLSNSEASINYEQARSANLDNRMKATDTYFQMRSKNTAYREAERGPRPTAADLARYAKLEAPKLLSPSELDPLTGKIRWPVILREDNFAPSREKVEEVFQDRSKAGYLNLDEIRQATAATDQMMADMRTNISQYPQQLYGGTKRFLESIRREITTPTQ